MPQYLKDLNSAKYLVVKVHETILTEANAAGRTVEIRDLV